MSAKYRVWFEDQHDRMEVVACTIRGLAVLVREGGQYHSFGIRYSQGRLHFALSYMHLLAKDEDFQILATLDKGKDRQQIER